MVDLEPLHVRAWNESLNKLGYSIGDLPETFRATMAGKKPIAIAAGMIKELMLPVSAERLLYDKTAIFMNHVTTELKGMPGVEESIKRFHDKGCL